MKTSRKQALTPSLAITYWLFGFLVGLAGIYLFLSLMNGSFL